MTLPSKQIKFWRVALAVAIFTLSAGGAYSQQFSSSLYSGMRWRLIGPFRGGRALAVAGIAKQPNVYYFGAVGGGVWKTTDGGRVWKPIFDGVPGVASIGALAIAPADPNVIYAGTGEADMRSDISFGKGVYKSTDGGETWRHMGLSDTRQIGSILVDPRNPNLALVAALGHAYGPNAERGVFRSTDGGRTWRKVLYKNENTGAIDLCFNPENPRIVYASLWQTRRPPWSTYPPVSGPGSGLYQSSDEGLTWKQITGHGLPADGVGRIGVAVAANDNGARVYALIDAPEGGLYRSDDAGENWRRVSSDIRIWGRGWYFGGVFADTADPNVVYVANTSLYRSIDGGKHFDAIKGAPGGDDYHTLWIAPGDPQRMIVGSDQGVTISVDGGKTWSSWYNQPTAQFYHVAVDRQFPFHVYGAQQDSGTAEVTSRSDYGEISFRDWHPIGAGESGYILPDPAESGIVYGGGTYGELFRFNETTGQSQNISPAAGASFGASGAYRFTWTSPLAFSPQDPRDLYFGSQFLLETADGGMSWRKISPDLTQSSASRSAPPSLAYFGGAAPGENRGVIYTVAPSPVRAGVIWSGTDNGLIQLTEDGGKTWANVTPAGVTPWSKISLIEASHFDAGTAYAAVDRHRLDDLRPYIYRTRDFGKTWREISAGISETSYVNAVREDPERKGLLFAGTETGAYVSFDDGDRWQSLQLNLPAASIRDLAIAGKDLVAATHGRSFWILDDIAPLEQINSLAANQDVFLFRPETAIRIRRSEARDTPLPPETPVGENPPAGAILDYYLKSAPAGEITLEILDPAGHLVRRYSSEAKYEPPRNPPNIPSYWYGPPRPLPKQAGMNRFVWDLRYPHPQSLFHGYSMAAIIGQNTPRVPEGPLALPGEYQVRLTVQGRSYTQPLELKMDPRVNAAPAGLAKQLAVALEIDAALAQLHQAYEEIASLRAQLAALRQRIQGGAAAKDVAALASELARKAGAIADGGQGFPSEGPSSTLARLNGTLASLAGAVDSADRGPTAQAVAAFAQAGKDLRARLKEWRELRQKDLRALNDKMREKGIPLIYLSAP